MKHAALCLFVSLSLAAQTRSSSANFTVDLLGAPDTRADTWGTAGVVTRNLTFKPPTGYRVRILRVYGDFVIWPKGMVAPGQSSGALFGLQTTGAAASKSADYAADGCMLYLQVATSGAPARAAYDTDVHDGGLLEADNVLQVKMAVFLNNTGLPIHMEPSFVLVYRWEKE